MHLHIFVYILYMYVLLHIYWKDILSHSKCIPHKPNCVPGIKMNSHCM